GAAARRVREVPLARVGVQRDHGQRTGGLRRGASARVRGRRAGRRRKAAHACTWPCAITERDPENQLTAVYEGLVHWADVMLVSTSIRWKRVVALLQDDRAPELRAEPGHDP